MNIGIMVRALRYRGYGISTYLQAMLESFGSLNTGHTFTLFGDPEQDLSSFDSFRCIHLSPSTANPFSRLYWDHLAVPTACRKYQIDVLLAPGHVKPLSLPCPSVVIIYDMMYHLFPDQWSFTDRTYMRYGVHFLSTRADRILTISHSTKRDILSLTSIPEQQIDVVHPGLARGFEPKSDRETELVRQKFSLPKPFILFVGSFHPRKNLSRLIAAFENISHSCPHDLAIVGARGWKYEELQRRVEESAVTERIKILGYVTENDLVHLYNQATVFVFPSLYEGFGLPVLEAMGCGCPVIAGNTSSLPEILGDCGVIVDTSAKRGLEDALLKLLHDPKELERLSKLGYERSKLFSWKESAIRIIEGLEKAAEKNSQGAK